ncbi:MAG: CoA-binding protein [Bacteroidota bacterium]
MKKTLVIGASTNPARYSNLAIRMLSEKEHPIIALGLREGAIGEVIITLEKKMYSEIDTITLYIGAKRQPEYYDYIVSLKPKRVIFNPGTANPEFQDLLEANDIEVMPACTLVLLRTNSY